MKLYENVKITVQNDLLSTQRIEQTTIFDLGAYGVKYMNDRMQ